MHTEKEARELWCPMARSQGNCDEPAANRWIGAGGDGVTEMQMNPPDSRCIASKCAMWRWGAPGLSDICHESVKSLGLDIRSQNALIGNDINTIRDVLVRSERELLIEPGLGKKSFGLIKNALAERGLRLGMTLPTDDPALGYCGLAGK